MTQQTHRQALPKGYMLQEYQLDRVLGHGGFGLTYLGWDTVLDKPVAVKEYLPNDLAVREANHSVVAKSGGDEDNFRWGLNRFLEEARTLARFKHPNIVPVYRCFEAHGTAYIVMEFVEGETFDAYLKRAGRPKESFLRAVLTALLDGLAEVHRAGFMHRDIKPGNIILNIEGAPVLVDFGSARQEIGGKSRSITSVVTPGYAPIEQYSSRGKQGPWTDIYALGAVAYRAVTGAPPPDATERVLDDAIKPAVDAGRGNYSAEFLRVVDHALAVNSKDRLQDVATWQRALQKTSSVKKSVAAKPEPRKSSVADFGVSFAEKPVAKTTPKKEDMPARSSVDTFRDHPEGPEMVVVPAGEFMMGTPESEAEAGRDDDEGPVHRVRIAYSFAVGVHEVTFAQWDACVADGGCNGYRPGDWGWGRGNRPVINVSWEDAQSYLQWLSAKSGKRYRLLSESEWEYAARAGTTTAYHFGGGIASSQANFNGKLGSTAPVGSYPANQFGLRDVHGNVWEWVQDCWNDSYRGAPSDGSAWESGDCCRRVLRGGSWVSAPRLLRSANRDGDSTVIRGSWVGFRVARTLTP